jgi:hypothetical protein
VAVAINNFILPAMSITYAHVKCKKLTFLLGFQNIHCENIGLTTNGLLNHTVIFKLQLNPSL